MSEEIASATQELESAKTSDNQVPVDATEPAKTSDNPAIDVGTEVKKEVEVKEANPYTDEEVEGLGDMSKADPRRLAKTLEANRRAYKELQGEFTRDRQRQSAEAQRTGRPSNPTDAFTYDVIEAAKNDDYVSVNKMLGSIDVVIEKKRADILQAMSVMDEEKARTLTQSLQKDVQFKTDLNVAVSDIFQQRQLYGDLDKSVDAEVFKAIPGFDKVAKEVGDYAINNIKMKKETIENTLDPRAYNLDYIAKKYNVSKKEALEIAKQTVVDLTKTMHSVYMRMSGKGLNNAEIKNPPEVIPGGNPVNTGNNNKINELRKKAERSGATDDWAAYYEEKFK